LSIIKTIEQRFSTALNNRRLDFISGETEKIKTAAQRATSAQTLFPLRATEQKQKLFGQTKNERS